LTFTETRLKGAYFIEIERLDDKRGFFARTFCTREFQANGLDPKLVQCNISFNEHIGTVRGMHYQIPPHAECKVVRCTMGAIFDVILDLRPGSPTFRQWVSLELSAENRKLVYIPEGVAHGFQTLVENTEVHYQMSELYHPECARGVRWDDKAFDIRWPISENIVISERDLRYPDYKC
jgi:dTDP-4-dehydrorhamnose 3,5-epimerase